MRSIIFAGLMAVSVLSVGACSKTSATEDKASTVPLVTIDQVDTMLASNNCVAVDANGEGTRKKMGVIPGAILLKDNDAFDASQLPTDKTKQLVFYCGSTQCGASHEAAEHALTAGYTNVKVMPDGIAGWVKAGKKVASI